MHREKYKSLIIDALQPKTEIWLGDDEGYFVQKETGRMNTSLLPGKYAVQFGLGRTKYEFDLNDDLEIVQTVDGISQSPV